jgi:hypothetical protein
VARVADGTTCVECFASTWPTANTDRTHVALDKDSPAPRPVLPQLHIHATMTADDGQTIALHADGVALPRKGSSIADLRENVTLSTSSKECTWVYALQVWAMGTVDLAEQVVRLKGLAA